MADAESLRQVAHSRAPLSTWLGIVLLFTLFGVIVLAVIGPAPRGSNYEETRARKRADVLKTTRDEAAKALTTYGWIDENKGVAHVPIERAMELTIVELAQKKPAPAGPVATPEPQPPAAPASAAAPPAAPSASPQPSGTPKPTSVASPSSESRGQPAAAVNPPSAPSGTQPGASAPPAGSPPPPAAAQPNPGGAPPGTPATSPATPATSPAGSPSPVPGKTP
jgi:hypothetical protein